jgi:hypothetical protein
MPCSCRGEQFSVLFKNLLILHFTSSHTHHTSSFANPVPSIHAREQPSPASSQRHLLEPNPLWNLVILLAKT